MLRSSQRLSAPVGGLTWPWPVMPPVRAGFVPPAAWGAMGQLAAGGTLVFWKERWGCEARRPLPEFVGFVPREQYFPLGPRSRRLLRPGACFDLASLHNG
jgi:hypothetical protein